MTMRGDSLLIQGKNRGSDALLVQFVDAGLDRRGSATPNFRRP